MNLHDAGKALLVGAVVLAAIGGVLLVLGSAGVKPPFGRLPGDLSWRRGTTRIYVPIASSLLVSVVLTVALNLLLRR